MNSFIFQIFWDCSSKKLLGNNYMYLIWNFAMWDHGGGDIGHIMLDFLTKRAIFLFQVIGKPSIEEFLWCQQKCTLDCEILGPLKPQTKKKLFACSQPLPISANNFLRCCCGRMTSSGRNNQVPKIVNWLWRVGWFSCRVHSPLHLSFSLPLLGDNNQGIRKSVFLSILDSVARVVLVNVSSLGKRLFCAAFSRTMPETILWVLVPFPLGWERLVTYGLPLAEVGVEAKCIDPT